MNTYRFTSTIDKFFSVPFLEAVSQHGICLQSVSRFSEQSELSVSLSLEGSLVIAMSQRLYESCGLDTSQVIVDSVNFSSTCRLLSFDLKALLGQSKRLKRLQERSLVLRKDLFACEFVAVCSSAAAKVLPSPTAIPSPKFSMTTKNIEWLANEQDLSLAERIEWMSMDFVNSSAEGKKMHQYTISGPIIPSSMLKEMISAAISYSDCIILGRAPDSLPPQPRLNEIRARHFNPNKFDPTLATADQQGFMIFKKDAECTLFRFNCTA